METSEQLTQPNSNELTSLQEDSPVRTLAASEGVPGSTETDRVYGPTSTALFANYDQALSLWKTLQACLTGELDEFLETWPKSGLMRNGKCFQQQPLALPTYGNAFILWPTPGANDHKGSFKRGQRRWQLDEAVENMPPWTQCLCCGEYLCTIHLSHVQECDCPPIEEWETDPYTDRAGGRLAPQFSEWLMGFPEGWTDLNQ